MRARTPISYITHVVTYRDLQLALDLLVSSKNSRGSISTSSHEACADETDMTNLLQVQTKLQCKLTQEVTGEEISSIIKIVGCKGQGSKSRSMVAQVSLH